MICAEGVYAPRGLALDRPAPSFSQFLIQNYSSRGKLNGKDRPRTLKTLDTGLRSMDSFYK